jgi:hypothetical protein
VPLRPALATQLKEWHTQTSYAKAKETDFVFPSIKAEGRVPISLAVFVADHLRRQPKPQAFGLPLP